MLESHQIVKAGGIVSMSAVVPADQRTGVMRARRYEHPALPGRVVVRLSADDIAAASDIEMETLGYDAPQASEPLGRQRFRALGFPGWALVNDPPHARFALEVMREFKQAARTAKSKPGHGRDAFVEIAKKLSRSVPHFLPSFWEEAGRAFLTEESANFAAQCFEKAREAEAAHGLKIDEDLRSSVYLEFALAGALAAKSLTGYGGDLEKAYGAKSAYPRFFELAVRRMLGGMPPWASMAKDLRGLGKRAGLDTNEEDERLLMESLDGKGLSRAPAEFWNTYRPALERLAAKHAAVRTRLRWLFPSTGSYNNPFAEDWLPFLDSTGALRAVTEVGTDEAALETVGSPAAWIQRLVAYAPRAEKTLAFIDAAAKRLIADGVPVPLVGKHGWYGVELDPTERLLSLGVPVAQPPSSVFNLNGATPRLDPVHVAAHPAFSALLRASVGQLMGQPAFESFSRGKKGFAAARRGWVVDLIESAGGGVPALRETIERLQTATSAETYLDFPEVHAQLASLDVARATTRTLRSGVLAEFTWPAFEKAVADLGGFASLSVRAMFPAVLIWNSTRVIAVDRERLAEHDFVMPPGGMLQWVAFVAGQFVVCFWDRTAGKQRGYWSSNVHETFDLEGDNAAMRWGEVCTVPLVNGAVSLGGAAIRPGDTRIDVKQGVMTDGTTCWEIAWENQAYKMREFDPATGKQGRFSWPAFVERETHRDDGMHIAHVSLQKLPPGTEHTPLGAKDGLSGFVRRMPMQPERSGEIVAADGRRSATKHLARGAIALVRMPGDDVDQLLTMGTEWNGGAHVAVVGLHDRDGYVTAKFATKQPESSGWPVMPPLAGWHYFETRSLDASRALRAIDGAVVSRWIADARGLDAAKMAARVVLDVPSLSQSPVLRDAVSAIVMAASEVVSRLETLRTSCDPAKAIAVSAPGGKPIDAKTFSKAFAPMLPMVHYDGRIDAEFDALSAWLAGEPNRDFPLSNCNWEWLLGYERFMAMRCFAPDVTESERSLILAVLQRLVSSVLTEDGIKLRSFRATIEPTSPLARASGTGPSQRTAFCTEHGASRYFVRAQGSYGQAATVVDVVERSRDGAFHDPQGAVVIGAHVIERNGERAWLEAFLTRAMSNTNWTWSLEAVDAIAQATGLNNAEAAIVWGVSPYSAPTAWGRTDQMDATVREALNLKAQDAKLAVESLVKVPRSTLAAVYEEAAQGDAATLFAPCESIGGTDSLQTRLIAAWNQRVDMRVPLREDVLSLVDKSLKPTMPAPALLRALLDPAASALFAVKTRTHASAFERLFGGKVEDQITSSTLNAIAMLIPFLFIELPVGDDYRARLGAFHARAMQAIADPELVLALASRWVEEKDRASNRAIYEGIGGTEIQIDAQNSSKVTARDNGEFIAALFQDGSQFQVSFRPSRVRDWENARVLWSLAESTQYVDRSAEPIAFLASRGCRAMIERIANTPVPAGRYEADPRVSCPDTLARVQKAHDLDANSATLYLQTLTLAAPTKSAVLAWNAWKPAEYKRAADALLAKKLLVEGKRERAGREYFLPGEWLKAESPNLPWESWKVKHHALAHGTLGRQLAPVPLHELFETAWKRVETGDVPRFEEV